MNIIFQDLRKGIKSNLYRYLIGIIIVGAMIFMFNKNILLEMRFNKQISMPGILDNILYLLCGMAEYIPTSGKPFELPYVWMAIQFLCSFLVFNYMQRDLEGMGLDILVRSKSRKVWWFSKCIWNVLTIISFYIVIYALCFMSSIILAGGKLGFEPSIFLKYMMIPIDNVNIQYFIILLLLIPLLTSIALSLVQMSFSIVVGPILSLMSIMIIDVFSAYIMNPYLVGNYSMLMRNRIVIRNGISPLICIFVNILLIIISIFLGGFIFSKKDIIENNGGSYEN